MLKLLLTDFMKYLKLIKLALFLTFLVNNISIGQSENSKETKDFYLIFSNSFFGNVSEQDARASLLVWSQHYIDGWAEYNGSGMTTKIFFTDEITSVHDVINENVASLFTIDCPTYFNTGLNLKYKPIFVGTADSSALVELLLIVRKDSQIKSFKDLENKKINLMDGVVGEINSIWFSTQVIKEINIRPDKHFESITREIQSSKALLNVFFKVSDACIITDIDYDIICELNPQLKKETEVILSSAKYLPAVSILVNNKDKRFETFIRNFAIDLTQKPYSEQVMKIFKINGIGNFKDEYLINISELMADYNRTIKKVIK
jgi:phosphonate ABC transporter substrate-binding protein